MVDWDKEVRDGTQKPHNGSPDGWWRWRWRGESSSVCVSASQLLQARNVRTCPAWYRYGQLLCRHGRAGRGGGTSYGRRLPPSPTQRRPKMITGRPWTSFWFPVSWLDAGWTRNNILAAHILCVHNYSKHSKSYWTGAVHFKIPEWCRKRNLFW